MSMTLDGTGDYVRATSSTDFDFANGDFTLCFWVNYANTANEQWFYQQSHDPSGEILFRKNAAAGNKLNFFATNSATQLSPQYTMTNTWNPNQNRWYHFAIARSSLACKMYINESSVAVTTNTQFSTLASVKSSLVMGVDRNLTTGISGQFAHIHVYNGRELSQKEINAVMRFPMSVTKSLVAYWPMWKTADSQADYTNKGHTGTIVNGKVGTNEPPVASVMSGGFPPMQAMAL